MSSVILEHVDNETYGKRLPTVFVNRIEIDYDDGPEDMSHDAVITAYLNIKFTKTPLMQGQTVEWLIHNFFTKIGLYTYLTYPDWVKTHLQENNFDLEYWMTEGRHEAVSSYKSNCYGAVSLSSLVSGTRDAQLIINDRFDQNGNEIIEINNIKIEMKYLGSDHESIPNVSAVPNLMFLAFVGYSASDLYGERYGSTSGISSNSSTFNKYFGDISWYHVLQNGETAPKFYEVYTSDNNIPYYGDVLQSVNGKIYSTDEYSFTSLRNDFSEMVSEYETERISDPLLDNNIKSLEAIIHASGNHVSIINQIETYRTTFPNKAANTQSGQFYNNLVLKFSEVIQKVESQVELSSKILYDSLVVDKRLKLVNPPYIKPSLDGSYDSINSYVSQRGTPGTTTSNDYIPWKQISLSRGAFLANTSDGRFDSSTIKKMYGSFFGDGSYSPDGEEGTSAVSWSDKIIDKLSDSQAGLTSEYSGLLAALTQHYKDEGYPDGDAVTMAENELDYQLTLGGSPSDLLNTHMNGRDYFEFRSGDFKVKNRGIFFFDYEKASRTQSKLSQVFNIRKLQHFFRINIPYEHFYVDTVDLARNEVVIPWQPGLEAENYQKSTMRLQMQQPTAHAESFVPITPITDPSYVDFPKPLDTKIVWEGGKPTYEDALDSYLVERLKYLSPMVEIGSDSGDLVFDHSYLTFVNFDVPISDPSRRLDGHNSMEGMGVTGYGPVENQRVMDGYRLMCFKFQDIMDDDVAWYNTRGNGDDEAAVCDGKTRAERIEETPDMVKSDAKTSYQITVRTQDITQVTYDRFVQYITAIYNDYTVYASEAAEICSHNNLNNTYNDFFVDSINEAYPEKPWYKAAHTAVALSELLFNSGATTQETFDSRVLDIILKIGPETGNLLQTQEFGKEFNGLMQYIRNDIVDISEGRAPAADAETPHKLMVALGASSARMQEYYQEREILETIFGAFMPDYIGPDHFNLSEAAPRPAIPSQAHSREGTSGAFTDEDYSESATLTRSTFGPDFTPAEDVDDPDFMKIVYELVFVPYDRSSWRYKMLGLPAGGIGEDTVPTGSTTTTAYMGLIQYYLSHQAASGSSYKLATYIASSMMISSTIDNKLNGSSASSYTGKRRASSSSISYRRNYRTLSELRYLMTNYFLPEAIRRETSGDTVVYSNRLKEAPFSITTPAWYRTSEVARNKFMSLANPRIRAIIEELILYIDFLKGEGSNPFTRLNASIPGATGDTATWATWAVNTRAGYDEKDDPYRILPLVDEDDPIGSERFVET